MQLWNNELARVAQNHANMCIFEYNQNRASQAPSFATVGENLFVTSAQTVNYTAAVKAWYDEVMYYDYNLNSCSGAIMCRNYIQVSIHTCSIAFYDLLLSTQYKHALALFPGVP